MSNAKKPVYQFYTHLPRGWFPLSRQVRDAVSYVGGVFETNDPRVIDLALADYNGPKKYIAEVNVDGKPYQPPVKATAKQKA